MARAWWKTESIGANGLALGESLPMIGRLLGHLEVQTAERYAHLVSDWVKESALRISESIAADILTGYPGTTVTPVPEFIGGVSDDGSELSPAAANLGRFRASSHRAA